jgi:hypothetical protein
MLLMFEVIYLLVPVILPQIDVYRLVNRTSINLNNFLPG